MTETAVAVIQSSAILANLQRVQAAAPDCLIMAVVKANAYGHGLEYVARLLSGVDALGVARVSEGIRLRHSGVQQRIVVLEGCSSSDEAREAVLHQLDLVVHDAAHFGILESVAGANVLSVWLKLDTGMGRLGFPPKELHDCLEALARIPAVRSDIRLMTHFACADDPDSPITMEQLRRFADVSGRFNGDVSLANSAGVLLWPQTVEATSELKYKGNNWVRPGLALFGASPIRGKSARELGLQPAMSFESRLISVKTISRGTTVGYGGDWRASRDTVVGVVAAGYGDGYPRHLQSGTPVLVNDRRVALIGRVSMDMISVDLTDVPIARVGDRVVLWGGHLPIEEIAARANTIPYELMCGLSERVEHRFIEAGAESVTSEPRSTHGLS